MRLRRLIIVVFALGLCGVIWHYLPVLNPAAVPEIPMQGLHPLVQETIEASQNAVRRNPGSAQAWGELGMVLIAHDFPVAARTCLQQAAQLDSEDFRWPYFIASTYTGSDFEAAREYYRQALDLNPGYLPLSLRMAQLLLRLGEIEEGIRVLEEARLLKPRDPYLLVTLGRLKLLKGDSDAARSLFEKAAQQPGWMPASAYQELLKIANRAGDHERAREYQTALAQFPQVARLEFPDPVFEAIRKLEGLSKSEAERADLALARGDTETAISLYESLVAKRDDLPTAMTNLANAYGMGGRYPDAISTYQTALKKFENYIPAMMGLAATYNLTGETQQAIDEYRRIVDIKPDHQQAWFLLGTIYEQAGDQQRALECYLQAAAVDPSYPPAQLGIGIILQQQGEFERAREYLQRAVELAPGDPTPAGYLKQVEKRLESKQ